MSKENKPNNPTFDYEDEAESKGFSIIIGVDEVGRGPLAGPVVAGAVCLKQRAFKNRILDSKSISPKRREEAFHEILDNAYVGIGIISEVVIDRVNILEASYLAMTNAVSQLIIAMIKDSKSDEDLSRRVHLLIDGNRFKSDLPFSFTTVTGGDAQVFSIACASIVAKVMRDRIITCYDRLIPQYGLAKHKGYPTAAHKAAIKEHGLSPIYRRSFKY